MAFKDSRFSNRRSCPAFSLIEVALAIGLVMFAALVIFSLLPVGLASLQSANRQIVETEVFNTIGAELASTPFMDKNGNDTLAQYVQDRFPAYFDVEGIEIKKTANNDPAADAIFTVRAGAPVTEAGGNELKRVTVSIGYNQDPADTGANASVRTFLLVNRQGKGE